MTFFVPDWDARVNGVRLPASAVADVVALEIVHEPNSLDHFALTLANPFPDLPYTDGEHASLFSEGNEVKIQLGYVDALAEVFDGEVTRLSAEFPEDGSSMLLVEGHSRLHWLRGATRTRTFQDVADSDIATQIATEAGLSPDVDSTTTIFPYVIQYNRTDLDFLLERAGRIRFELSVTGRTFAFRKARDGDPPAVTLVWGSPQRAFGGAPDTLPLRRFAPVLDALRPAGRLQVRGVDPLSRDAIVATVTTVEAGSGPGTPAVALAAKAFARASDAVFVDMPVASQEEAEAVAHARFDARSLGLVSATGACVGSPSIRAGSTVELVGVGRRFSGPYYVTRATHHLDEEGCVTSFSARKGSA